MTLDCPSECPYLQQARQHQEPRNLEELPAEEVFPAVRVSEDFLRQRETLIAGTLQKLADLSRRDPQLHDRDIVAALSNMATGYQTLITSGLMYQQQLPNLVQQGVADTLHQLVTEFRELERKHRGRAAAQDEDVLKAVVFLLRLTQLHTSGRPRSRGFLDFVRKEFAEAVGAAEVGSRLIIP